MWFKRKSIALIALLVVAGFLRLYNIGRYMQFQGDEGRDSLVLWQMAVEKKLTLIGPGTSVGNMYNGPLYYYLVLPSFVAAGLSPVGPSIFVALLGMATVWLIYIVGTEWWSPMAGSTAAVLYALSPTVIIYSRSSWNPNVMPFFALLCVYSIWKVYKQEDIRWLLATGASLAFAIQSHYLALLLAPTLFVWWLVAFKKTDKSLRPIFKQYSVYAFLVFFILMSPLLLFDLRHNFLNTRAMIAFFSQRQTTVNFKVYKALPNIPPLFRKITTTLLTAGVTSVGDLLSVFSGVGLLFLLVREYRKSSILILTTWILFGLIGLGLYKQSIYDHYFGFFFPAFFILLGIEIGYLWRSSRIYRIGIAGVLLGLFWMNLERTPILAKPNDLLLHTQLVSQTIIEASAGQPFNLAMIAKQNYDAGYRFLLTGSGASLKDAPQDITQQLFVVCEIPTSECQPVGNPKAEIANFGWTKIDRIWYFPWGVTLYRLIHNQP